MQNPGKGACVRRGDLYESHWHLLEGEAGENPLGFGMIAVDFADRSQCSKGLKIGFQVY